MYIFERAKRKIKALVNLDAQCVKSGIRVELHLMHALSYTYTTGSRSNASYYISIIYLLCI